MFVCTSKIKRLLFATLLALVGTAVASGHLKISPTQSTRGYRVRGSMLLLNERTSETMRVHSDVPKEAGGHAFEPNSGREVTLEAANPEIAIHSVDDQAQANEEVLKMNEECNAAELRGDVTAMDNCETDDFTHTHANGTVEYKAEYLKGVGSGAHKFLLLDLSEVHVRSYETAAIVEGHIHLRANNSGKIADVNNLFMTVWVKQHGKWREAAWIADRVPKDSVSGSEGK